MQIQVHVPMFVKIRLKGEDQKYIHNVKIIKANSTCFTLRTMT